MLQYLKKLFGKKDLYTMEELLAEPPRQRGRYLPFIDDRLPQLLKEYQDLPRPVPCIVHQATRAQSHIENLEKKLQELNVSNPAHEKCHEELRAVSQRYLDAYNAMRSAVIHRYGDSAVPSTGQVTRK